MQRIGIARAIYKNSQVLVLDEATSALDNKTEKKLMNSIINSDSYDKEYTYSGISLLDPCVIPQGESLNKELWNDVLKPLTKDNKITGEVFHGLVKNINKVNDIEELDVAITE